MVRCQHSKLDPVSALLTEFLGRRLSIVTSIRFDACVLNSSTIHQARNLDFFYF
jgi:hypothetical protein